MNYTYRLFIAVVLVTVITFSYDAYASDQYKYSYNVEVVDVIDGDTVDVNINLGFGVWLMNERVRLLGIDTPESRTSDDAEDLFGELAKKRVKEYLDSDNVSLVLNDYEGGKFGRILGDLKVEDQEHTLVNYLLDNHYGVKYYGQSKDDILDQHLNNRIFLLDSGEVDKNTYREAVCEKYKEPTW